MSRADLAAAAWVYLGIPTGLSVLFGWPSSAGEFADQWLQSFVCTLAIGGCVQILYAIAQRRRPAGVPEPLIHGTLVLVGTTVGSEVGARALALGWGFPPSDTRAGLLRVGFVVTVVTVAFQWLVGRLREQIRAAELREEHARRAALMAELRAVQARTQPHFLFNALNVVSALVQEDPARAGRVLDHLAALFQYALQAGARSTVPLEEELDAVRDYVAVEQTRFGDGLAFAIEVEPGAEGVAVPPLCVQPLVENAVQHGIRSRPGPGRVVIRAATDGARLRVTVEDDGVGMGASTRSGNGVGLADLRERLRLLYGDDATLEITASVGTRAALDLPVQR